MKIIAHRGKWDAKQERNTLTAFREALLLGYGVETDIRDYVGNLVISHDIANEFSVGLHDFFLLYEQLECNNILALNVKSDGIQDMLSCLLKKYNIDNYFMFDMSIPEMIVYAKKGLRFFTRQSDVEKECVLYEAASGVWVDSFYHMEWITAKVLDSHLEAKKKVVIVSPELHGWEYLPLWTKLKRWGYHTCPDIYLCTDYPGEAKAFMGEL